MHFEVIFRSDKTFERHISYGLVWTPGPVWVDKKKEVVNMAQQSNLATGCVKKLIVQEKLHSILGKDNLKASIIIRNIGHGEMSDFEILVQDLMKEGFSIEVFGKVGTPGAYTED